MPQFNVNDRTGIERFYPADEFMQDAGRNALADAAVLYGVRIMSEPDAKGAFELVRAKQQVGERDPQGDTIFLPPALVSDAQALRKGDNAYAGQEEVGDALEKTRQKGADYEKFITNLIEIAKSAGFKSAVGRDERLKGFHGG